MLPDMIHFLQSQGMLRRAAKPEVEFVETLFHSKIGGFPCPECAQTDMEVSEESFDDEWGDERACQACGTAIPLERLELFPDAELCTACQQKLERGESVEQEYCPKCGDLMRMQTASGSGLARYTLFCPSCRRSY